MNDQSTKWRFGFLAEPIDASFDGVHLTPLPDHSQRLEWFLKSSNIDGFFYPPQIATYVAGTSTKRRKKVPRSERPAAAYHLPASHELSINAPVIKIHPYSDAVLLTQLFAFIFGTRLQLEEWKFEGRVPQKSTLAASITNQVRINFIRHVYRWWTKLEPPLRTRVINVFYAYNRAVDQEWDWEAFIQQYIVFDALFKLHADMTSRSSRTSHKRRFDILFDAYKIPFNHELVATLYRIRHELFHEGMWANAMVGFQTTEPDDVQLPRHLRRLNARLLCAITGYRNSFTSSAWWAMGQFYFDAPTVHHTI